MILFKVSIHASVKDATVVLFSQDHQAKVSIHASVKDATCIALEAHFFKRVSIHASVKDATFLNYLSSVKVEKFQSTHL